MAYPPPYGPIVPLKPPPIDYWEIARSYWKYNPVTTSERMALISYLSEDHKYLEVTDSTLDKQFTWDGTQWIETEIIGSSSAVLTIVTAGENIGGGKVVALIGGLAYNFDTSNPSHYSKSIGISNQASSMGDTIEVVTSGLCNQMGGLIPGEPYYASTGGNVSPTPVPSGISQIVGVAETATSIIVQLQKPYIVV